MLRAGRNVRLGRSGPHHHPARRARALHEVTDVGADLLREIALVLAGLDVGRARDARHVAALEHGWHRLDALEEIGDRFDVRLVEHAGVHGRLIRRIGNRIPSPEDDVVELRERDKVLDERAASIGALAEANRRHLGQRADRHREPATHALNTGDERGGDGAETRREDGELPRCRGWGRGVTANRVGHCFTLQGKWSYDRRS